MLKDGSPLGTQSKLQTWENYFIDLCNLGLVNMFDNDLQV